MPVTGTAFPEGEDRGDGIQISSRIPRRRTTRSAAARNTWLPRHPGKPFRANSICQGLIQDRRERFDKRRQFNRDTRPQDIPVNVKMAVDQAIPHRRGCSPRQIAVSARASGETLLAASPSTSTARTTAKSNIRHDPVPTDPCPA